MDIDDCLCDPDSGKCTSQLLSSNINEDTCVIIKCFEDLGFNNIIALRYKVLTQLVSAVLRFRGFKYRCFFVLASRRMKNLIILYVSC